MTFSNLIKQPWFQILAGAVIFILILLSVYYWGVSAGRAQKETEFDRAQAELLKKSQDAVLAANVWKDRAESAELYAEKLKVEIGRDRATALANEERISSIYENETKEITQKYDAAKKIIASDMSDCDRCRDLCERSNRLVAYGPEFAAAKCDPAVDCRFACNPGDS